MKTLVTVGAVSCRQLGAALVVCLLMLSVILLLGIYSVQIALQEQKTARNEMDRQLAFQAAEVALSDAELDIEASPDSEKSRSRLFSAQGVSGLPEDGDFVCGSGISSRFLGICKAAIEGVPPAWQGIDFLDSSSGTASSVPYGRFTGQPFPTGDGALSGTMPRYLIELIPDRTAGERADQLRYVYRITAIGFGMHQKTQVVLQTLYRKLD